LVLVQNISGRSLNGKQASKAPCMRAGLFNAPILAVRLLRSHFITHKSLDGVTC
jgi:hypothetical protein